MSKTFEKRISDKKKADNFPIVSRKGLNGFRRILLILLAFVIFYPPFLRGLYFEEEQLPTEIIVFIIFIVFWLYKALKKDKKFLQSPLDYASIAFTAVYLLSMVVAINKHSALNEWLKYCMYFAIFFMLSELANTYRTRLIIIWIIVVQALCVSLLGIDGATGAKISNELNTFFKNVNILDGFFMIFSKDRDALFGLFVGGRINSTLQYPNALASYLISIYFVTLGIITASKNIWTKLVAGAAGYILLITFILTMSRGAYILFPVAAILYVVLIPKGERVSSITYAFPSIIGVGLTVIQLSDLIINKEGNETAIWKYIIIGTIISVVLSFILHFITLWLKKLSWKVYAFLSIILVLVGIAGATLALVVKEPLELSHTINETDSFKSIKRSFQLKPGKEYKLIYELKVDNVLGTKDAYMIDIFSRNIIGTLSGKDTHIKTISDKLTNGIEQREIRFAVPTDSRTISIQFVNQYQGTRVTFYDAKIIPVDHIDKEHSITLKYKFIPEKFYSRINEAKESKSTLDRMIFYKDGLKVITDNGHWVLGAGGGAWALLYFGYQSYLYWTTQAHTYLVQIALECGILGLIVLLLLIGALVSSLANELRRRKTENTQDSIIQAALFTAISVLLLHSFMDFDLSLSAVFLLLWELLALYNARIKSNDDLPVENINSAWSRLLVKMDIKDKIRKQGIYPIVGVITTLMIIVIPITFLSAKFSANEARKYLNASDIKNALRYMQKAAETDGLAYEYKVDYANLLLRQDQKSITQTDFNRARKYVSQSEKAAEHNVDLAIKLASFYFGTGSIDKGLYFIERATELRPLRPEEWQQKADAYMQIAIHNLQSGDTKKGEEFFEKIEAIPNEVKEVNKRNMIPFTLTPATQEILEKVRLLKENVNGNEDVDLSKLVFYPLNDVDVNMDGIPDQWSSINADEVQLGTVNGNITAESLSDKTGYIKSRVLSLQPGKTYEVEVELNNFDIKSIPFTVSGVTNKTMELKLVDGVYTAIINTSSDFKKDNNALLLGVNGKYEIKSVNIMEQ